MKTLRWTALVVIVMFFIVGLGFMAWSGPIKIKPSFEKLMGCPDGWYVKPGSSSEIFRCKPKEPTMSCLDGYEYYWDGCEVGCTKIPDRPR